MKTAVVTGGARRPGQAVARRPAVHGRTVAALGPITVLGNTAGKESHEHFRSLTFDARREELDLSPTAAAVAFLVPGETGHVTGRLLGEHGGRTT